MYPDFSQPFIVAFDASTKAIGAVLSQVREGEERPVPIAAGNEILLKLNTVGIVSLFVCY